MPVFLNASSEAAEQLVREFLALQSPGRALGGIFPEETPIDT